MWSIIMLIFIVVVAIIGVTELLRRFWLYIITPKDAPPKVMLIFLKEEIAVQQLRAAAEYLSWEGPKTFYAIAAIDAGLSEETKNQVIKIVNSRSDMLFGSKELQNLIADYK